MEFMNNTLVKEIMIKSVKTIHCEQSIYDACKLMVDHNIGSLIVTNKEINSNDLLKKEDVVGMVPVFFTLKHILKSDQAKTTSVSECMFSDMVFIHEEAPLSYALSKVTSNKTWRLMVFNKYNHIVGILSSADIMKYICHKSAQSFHIAVGEDTNYFGIKITWLDDNTMRMTRQEEFVTEISGIVDFSYDEMYNQETEQSMMFLKVFSKNNEVRAFFLDADPVQTNAREVDSSLGNLKEVLNWLLPPGYLCRQGDIGFYTCNGIPKEAIEVDRNEYEEYFIKPFHKRHLIEPKENCDFYVLDSDEYYINVKEKTNIVHPEHHLVQLPLGPVKVLCARGEPLPKIIGLKDGEKIMD